MHPVCLQVPKLRGESMHCPFFPCHSSAVTALCARMRRIGCQASNVHVYFSSLVGYGIVSFVHRKPRLAL